MSQPGPILWGFLAIFTALGILALIRMIRVQRRRQSSFDDRPVIRDEDDVVIDPDGLEAIAANAVVAAQRAAIVAAEALAEHAEAEALRDAVWQEHGIAARALETATTATGSFPVISSVSGTDQKEISRAARAAYRRGEISVDELQAVWQRVGGWDPVWAQRAHELAKLRADGAETWRRYELAALAERAARMRADVAVIAARALADEAAEAAREAELSHRP
ncbi:hypothetical protein F4553_003101 [Allocatelliglobosispora scoriae]|uniref:Uncharacterized protein n=1 Tax=Allocatelliglobosispora scoriae TaxID=643052 RepID=A0A841BSK9_9ACTN|nr:hypothetical protein [Allocatelliglobosispora scoriae]MBB5869722.1 hypothetical protein [Allocatelliglobosispora scoriae]